jgi:two-component system, cell cycle sensor histidine kinase and response regulator CckA
MGMSVRSKTILLVDDEASQREKLRRALRTAGYRVVVCADYGTAVAAFQQYPGVVDMLVTDLSLPGKNGYELAETLRDTQPKLKVLFTSAHAGAELGRFYGIATTDHRFLAKPFKPADLLERIRYLLERAEPKTGSVGC